MNSHPTHKRLCEHWNRTYGLCILPTGHGPVELMNGASCRHMYEIHKIQKNNLDPEELTKPPTAGENMSETVYDAMKEKNAERMANAARDSYSDEATVFKTRKQTSVYLDPETLKWLDEMVDRNGLTRSALMDLILRDFRYNARTLSIIIT